MKNLITTLLTLTVFNLVGMQKGLLLPAPTSQTAETQQLALQPATQVRQATRGDLKVFLALPDELQQRIIFYYLQKHQQDLMPFREWKTLTGHTDWVNCVVKLTNKLIASASNDTTIKILDIETGECTKTLTGHTRWVRSISKLTDKLIASVSWDKTIKIWNIEAGQCTHTLTGHTDNIESVDKLSDKLIASASWDHTIKIWDIETGQCTKTLKGHTNIVNSAIKLTDKLIVSVSSGKIIKIWNIETGQCIQTLTGHADRILDQVKLTDNIIASSSDDRTIKLWKKPRPYAVTKELFSINNPLALLMLLQEGDLPTEDKFAIKHTLAQSGGSVDKWLTTIDPAFVPIAKKALSNKSSTCVIS